MKITNEPKKRKPWVRVLTLGAVLALGSALLLSGCKPGGGDASAPPADYSVNENEPVTIRVGIWAFDSDAAGLALWEGYKNEMKEKYPNITLQPEPYSYTSDTFIPMAVSGTAPDIFVTRFTEPNRLISNGYVADVTYFAEKYGFKDGMEPSMLAVGTMNGKIYGIPRDGYALSLMMNKSLFEQAGLTDENGLPIYPKTYAELAQTAKTITERTGKPGLLLPTRDRQGGWQFSNIAWSFGATLQYQDESGKWLNALNSDACVQTLQYYKELRWSNALPEDTLINYEKMYQIFGTGQAAMMFAGSDSYVRPVRDYGMDKDLIAVAPLPAGPNGDQYSLLGGNMFMFSKDASANELDACFKLLQVIGMKPTADEQTLKAIEDELKSRESLNYPIGPRGLNVWKDPERIAAEDALYEKYTNVDMKLYQPFYDKVYDTLRAEEPYYCQEMYSALDKAIQTIMTDQNADPKAELDKAAKEFQIILDQAY